MTTNTATKAGQQYALKWYAIREEHTFPDTFVMRTEAAIVYNGDETASIILRTMMFPAGQMVGLTITSSVLNMPTKTAAHAWVDAHMK